MSRSLVLAVLGGVGMLLSTSAAAQPPQWTPAYVPPNPLYNLLPYQYQLNVGVPIQTTYGRAFVGWTAPFTPAPQYFSPNYGMGYGGYTPPWMPRGTSMGYMSGGSASGYSAAYSTPAAADFQKAQYAAGAMRKYGYPDEAKKTINEQWDYEKGATTPAPAAGGKAPAAEPDALQRALGAADEHAVASGEALNHILAAITASEAKGAKGVSAYLPPRVLDEIRFGTPAGDALNLVRLSGRLPFPPAFAAPELVDLRDALERDFAAVADPLLTGKAADPTKVTKLEQTLKKAEDLAPPVIRNLSFEEAIASRKFLNQLSNTVRFLKSSSGAGLVVPAWSTEGANVAELVKQMTKFKLQFAPAQPGSEPIYFALHKALSAYFFVLNQPKK
jgi:hypothetical protein